MTLAAGRSSVYDIVLKRPEPLMGASGLLALVKDFMVFKITLFARIGGPPDGYNQGTFIGILTVPNFEDCTSCYAQVSNCCSYYWIRATMIPQIRWTRQRKGG
jgi:hypothetical protein